MIFSREPKYSRWSASIFKIMEIAGLNFKKVSTYSQASQIIISDLPARPLLPINGSFPPMIAEGSFPAWINNCVSIPVVVVFPCVPETAMES